MANPWAGYYLGQQSLSQTLDTLSERRRQEKLEKQQQAQQEIENRRALRTEALAKEESSLRNAVTQEQLAEYRRKAQAARQWDAERRGLAQTLGTETVEETYQNPDYVPARSGGLAGLDEPQNEAETAARKELLDIETLRPGTLASVNPPTAAVGTPTLTRTSQLSESTKLQRQLDLALKHGMTDEAANIAKAADVTREFESKIDPKTARVLAVMKGAKDAGLGSGSAKAVGIQEARRIDPSGKLASSFESLEVGADGMIQHITTPDGRYMGAVYIQDGKATMFQVPSEKNPTPSSLALDTTSSDPATSAKARQAMGELEKLESARGAADRGTRADNETMNTISQFIAGKKDLTADDVVGLAEGLKADDPTSKMILQRMQYVRNNTNSQEVREKIDTIVQEINGYLKTKTPGK